MKTKIKKEKAAVKKKITVSKTKNVSSKVAKAKVIKKPKAIAVKPKPAPKKLPLVAVKPLHIEPVPKKEERKPTPPVIKQEVKEIVKPHLVYVAPVKKEIPVSAPVSVPVVPPEPQLKELELKLPLTLKDLSVKLQEKPSALIKILMGMRMMIGINQALDEKTASIICSKFGFKIKQALSEEEIALSVHQQDDSPDTLKPRSPIVTFMGHVDHGKTSLLDAVRKTKVAESEHGGITQHIGAYRVVLPAGEITFLDTPGHEAFTAMRARGASVTDIVVLVVAADDGIMPQTIEAIDHARAAGVPIIVAINKIDKAQANLDKVKKQLSEHNLAAEDWGGKTITVAVSAKTGEGIDNLLEMILLEAQMLELRANPKRPAKGVVIEAKMSKGRGPVSTLLVRTGTLHVNNNIIVGKFYGKIRAMFNDHGQSVTVAGPSYPVEVLGVSGIPQAGEEFFAIEDEKLAKELAANRQEQGRQDQIKSFKRVSLEDLYAQIKEGKIKELKIIIKADVQGSLESIKDTLNKLNVS